MGIIFIIGHSLNDIDTFVKYIRSYDVNTIADIRSVPYSKHNQSFNREALKSALCKNDIQYIFMGNELGARRTDKALYSADGCLDFTKTAESELFLHGIDRLKTGMEKGFVIALMCVEKDPIECHRSILIGNVLSKGSNDVQHIIDSTKLQSQRDLELRMLDMYFPKRMQMGLDEGDNSIVGTSDYIAQAYAMRNKGIGYRL